MRGFWHHGLTSHFITSAFMTMKSYKRSPRDPRFAEQSVSRMTLRQVLLPGLDDLVHFDRVFSH